jgi:hypothetical protein
LDESAKYLLKAIDFFEKIVYAIFNARTRMFLADLRHDIKEYQNSKNHHARTLWFSENYGIYSSWIAFYKFGVAKAQLTMNEKDAGLILLYGYVYQNKVKIFEDLMQGIPDSRENNDQFCIAVVYRSPKR